MALNKYMHPRNIYKVPPDFGNLAKINPEFSAISKLDASGKVTIDFKDANSLRILTKCLLKSDFNLDVEIPKDRLVPTLPLRLNYILWLEDLMVSIHRDHDIKGLDIGTGACAIYPLLAVAHNKWNMLATETDTASFAKAQENVQRNSLQESIKLIKNTTKSLISHVFKDEDKLVLDFCMCNPPFYSNVQELCDSRSPARLPPKNGFTGSPQELITEGGELEFCRKLVAESKEYKDNILIFTTMLGHKYNLSVLLQELKSENIKHTHAEFCQGRVTRWGLAWTYQNYDLIKLVPPRDKPRKKQAPTIYLLPQLPNCDYNTEVAFNKIKELLSNLSISYKLLEKRGNNITLDIVANSNTWSNQRRKRRQQRRSECEVKKSKLEPETVTGETNDDKNTSAEQTDLNPADNSMCMAENPNTNVNGDEDIASCKNEPLVHALTKVMRKANDILLEVDFLDGTAGKEGLHQIVQYIKNNWK